MCNLTICLQVMGYHFVPWKTSVLGLPQSVDQGPDEKWEKALLGPLLQQEEQASSRSPCSLPKKGWAGFLGGGWGEGSRGWATGWLGCFARPFGDAAMQGHAQYPALAPGFSEMAVEFSGLFVSFVHNSPHCPCRQLFLVPYSFFVFVDPGDICPDASVAAPPRRVSGPRLPGSPKKLCTLIPKGMWPKVSSPRLPPAWQGPQTPACPGGMKLLTECSGKLGVLTPLSPGMGWIPCLILSLTPNCWSPKDTNLTRRLNKQGQKREKTTISIKGPRKRKNQGNFERASLNCWPDRLGGTILAKIRKHFCLAVYFC